MFISPDILRQIYPTLLTTAKLPRATNETCNLLDPSTTDCCNACPFYTGNPHPGHSCALDADDNPDLEESWTLFYEAYPEYLI